MKCTNPSMNCTLSLISTWRMRKVFCRNAKAMAKALIASPSGLRCNDARGLGVLGWWPDLPPVIPTKQPTAPQTNPMRRPTLSASPPTTNLTTSSQVSGSLPTTNLTIPYYANQQGVSTDHIFCIFSLLFSFLCRRPMLSGSLPTTNLIIQYSTNHQGASTDHLLSRVN